MTTTDDARLVEIEAREQAATPGPWRLDTARIYALTATGAREVAVVTKADPIVRANAACNGDFIANAREDVRYLIDRLKAAESRIRETIEWCDEQQAYHHRRGTSYNDGMATAFGQASERIALHSDEVQEEGNGG